MIILVDVMNISYIFDKNIQDGRWRETKPKARLKDGEKGRRMERILCRVEKV